MNIKGIVIGGLCTITATVSGALVYRECRQIWLPEQTPKAVPRAMEHPIVESLKQERIEEIVSSARVYIPQSVSQHDVAKHLRRLPDGWHASPIKIDTAPQNGFVLDKDHTWVRDFRTGKKE